MDNTGRQLDKLKRILGSLAIPAYQYIALLSTHLIVMIPFCSCLAVRTYSLIWSLQPFSQNYNQLTLE